jgi:hypothetical protein
VVRRTLGRIAAPEVPLGDTQVGLHAVGSLRAVVEEGSPARPC